MRAPLFLAAGLAALIASPDADLLGADLSVCGWTSANVLRCDDDGSACATFVASGAGGLSLAHSIEFGADGDMYVTSFDGNRVLRFDGATGAFIDHFVPSGSGGLVQATDAVFGPDGHLYVTSFGTDCVLRYDGASGAFLDEFVTSGSGGLVNPEALAFMPNGDLLVISGANRNVLRYDGTTGAFVGVFVPTGSGGMLDPHYMFFHQGRLHVTAFGNSKVLRFSGTTGAFIDVFVEDDPGTAEDESGGLSSAHGAAFGPDGDLYVASFNSNQVLRYDGATGAFAGVAIDAGVTGPIDVVFRAAPCATDLDGDGATGFADLLAVLADWGPCGAPCPADLDEDGAVGFADLLAVLAAWGACGR